MGREYCPHVPCVTSGGRARFARPWCGWRRGGARRVHLGPGHRHAALAGARRPRRLAHHRRTTGSPEVGREVRARRAAVEEGRADGEHLGAPVRLPWAPDGVVQAARLGGELRHRGVGISAPHRASRARGAPGRRAQTRRRSRRRGSGRARRPSRRRSCEATPRGRGRRSPTSRPARRSTDAGCRGRRPCPAGPARGQVHPPSRCASSASARWWVLTATVDGASPSPRRRGGPARGRPGACRRPGTAPSAARGERESRVPPPAASTMPARMSAMGDPPVLQPLAAPDAPDRGVPAVHQRVLPSACSVASRCCSSRSRRAPDRPTASPTRKDGATDWAWPSPFSPRLWSGPPRPQTCSARQPHQPDVRGRARGALLHPMSRDYQRIWFR